MFSFKLSTELQYFNELPEFIQAFSVNKDDLIVTNEVIYNNSFKKLGTDWNVLFQEAYGLGEPNDKMINKLLADAAKFKYKRVIAVGGGTVIDIGKLMTLQGVTDVLDVMYGKIPVIKDKTLIVLPTTCGTGSEVTNISILEDTVNKVKKGIVHQDLFPDIAVLIPELLQGLPFKFFAFSSVDALIHAVESYLAPKSNPVTELFGIKAMEMIISTYKEVAAKGQQAAYDNIGNVLLASTYAGIAFGNTGVGAVHAMSYPLGGKYHVPHGEANYAFFDAVLRTYEQYNSTGKIVQLKEIITGILNLPAGADALGVLDELINKVTPRKRLREYGMVAEDLNSFTKGALEQERLMKNNYVSLSSDDVFKIYQSLY